MKEEAVVDVEMKEETKADVPVVERKRGDMFKKISERAAERRESKYCNCA